MPSTKPRIQIVLDQEPSAAEPGAVKARPRAMHNLPLRDAEATRAEEHRRSEALNGLRRICGGEDDRFDFSVSAQLHAERR